MFSVITASKLTQTVPLTYVNFSTILLLRRLFEYIFIQVTAGKGNYDITETRRDVYKYSKLYKLLWRVNQTMEDMLRTVQTDTLSEYTFFIENVRYVVSRTCFFLFYRGPIFFCNFSEIILQ